MLLLLLACHRDPPPPDVLLVVLDTVRADHVSAYGYERQTTPNLDALAAEGAMWTAGYSTSGWTSPAHASLFTGLFPATHHCTQQRWTLDPDLTTIAEDLSAAGYATSGFVGNPMLSRQRRFGQGFDRYVESWREGPPDPTSVARAADVLTARADRPRFVFVNLIGAHAPYDSCGDSCGVFGASPDGGPVDAGWRDVYRGRTAVADLDLPRLTALYDAELHEVDRHLGALIAAAPADAVILVVSDHGENLGDHGHVDHVFSLYESTTRVPIVARGLGSGVHPLPVQLVDVHATIRAITGLPPSGAGRDLRTAPDRPVLLTYDRPRQALASVLRDATPEEAAAATRWDRPVRAWIEGGDKLIEADGEPPLLFRLPEDRDETAPIDDPARAAALHAALEARLAALTTAPTAVDDPELDPETRAALEALGYVE